MEPVLENFTLKKSILFFLNDFQRILFSFFGIFKIFWPSVLNLAYRQGYRYGVLYRPIPITDTDRKFSYRQNRLSADNRYIGRYRYISVIGSYTALSMYFWCENFKLMLSHQKDIQAYLKRAKNNFIFCALECNFFLNRRLWKNPICLTHT